MLDTQWEGPGEPSACTSQIWVRCPWQLRNRTLSSRQACLWCQSCEGLSRSCCVSVHTLSSTIWMKAKGGNSFSSVWVHSCADTSEPMVGRGWFMIENQSGQWVFSSNTHRSTYTVQNLFQIITITWGCILLSVAGGLPLDSRSVL